MKEKNQALQFAMKLIGIRKRSVFEVTERLKKKGFKENIIKEILKELKNYKYLNDEQFAESYINDRMNFRPCGRFLIMKELRERGIVKNIINKKIEELLSVEIEIESAKRLARKKIRAVSCKTDKNKINQKTKSYLQSRGYAFDIISQVINNEMK
ncbi:MAG: regulatory protein RecX [Candidatus Pacebacteria bacterium]|nr:regulatory protein RecX [Candidatus Paceibacterota bacterium]